MLNIILIICEVIVAYIAMILLYKKYKTDGLITYTIIATIISNLMCLKKIDMLNTELPLGLGITMSILIAINIITQNKGKEEVNNFLVIILVSSIVSLCFFNLSGLIESADINKYANKSYDSIFTYNLRIYLANTITLLVTAFLSSRLYFMLKIFKWNIFHDISMRPNLCQNQIYYLTFLLFLYQKSLFGNSHLLLYSNRHKSLDR